MPGSGAGPLGRIRFQVEEDRQQFRPRDTVHGGVVHLGDEPDAAPGQTFDDPHLPEGPSPIQRSPGDVTGDGAQLAQAPGTRDKPPTRT